MSNLVRANFACGLGQQNTQHLFFEKEDGTKFEVLGWEWDWGDLDTLYIGNVVLFNDYISQIEFDEDTEFDYYWLYNLSNSYGENYGREN